MHVDLLNIAKQRKFRWHGHISRASGVAKASLQETVKETRRRGRQRKKWAGNINNWIGLEFLTL